MLYTPDDFPDLLFTSSQRRALMALAETVARDEEKGALVAADLAVLLSGKHAVAVAQATLDEVFPGLGACYPALVILQAIPQLIEQYRAHGIPLTVLWDAMNDLPLWMSSFERAHGFPGLAEYSWLSWYVQFKLFRLGRLEYISTVSRVPAHVFRREGGALCVLAAAGLRFGGGGRLVTPEEPGEVSTYYEDDCEAAGLPVDEAGLAGAAPIKLDKRKWTRVLSPGDPVLDVHIPEGPRLDPAAVARSLAAAPDFYREHLGLSGMRAFTCDSWLLSTALPEMLPGSCVAQFQQLFRMVPYTTSDKQIFERVFGREKGDLRTLPQETTLQRAVVARYLSGGECRNMAGFILL